MRQKLLLLVLLFSGLCHAKTEYPEWMNNDRREAMFPSSTYYCGFAVAEIGKNDVIEETMDRLKQSAYGDLMSKISVTVQHQASDTLKDVVGTNEAYSSNVYSSVTTLTTRMTEIPGIEVKTFMDADTRMAAVLAYVQKEGLANKLQRQLLTQITRVNVKLEDADGFMVSGNRSMAREAVANARNVLQKAEDTRQTMMAINHSVSGEDLMDKEWRAAEMKIIALESELNRNVKVSLSCTLDDKENNSLKSTLSGELYRNGCEMTDSVGNAEFRVEVTATTTPYNKVTLVDYVFYYSFAVANLKIMDKDGKEVYSDEMRIKGCHTKNFSYASAAALQQLTVELCKTIKPIVQK